MYRHGKINRLLVVAVNYESAWRLEKELFAYDADLVIVDNINKNGISTVKNENFTKMFIRC
ncbi:MAG: hypothetical protein LIO81_10180 [Clostridiales bacterium]|nr:hypothetical protein [Clostridiales bacterium]